MAINEKVEGGRQGGGKEGGREGEIGVWLAGYRAESRSVRNGKTGRKRSRAGGRKRGRGGERKGGDRCDLFGGASSSVRQEV